MTDLRILKQARRLVHQLGATPEGRAALDTMPYSLENLIDQQIRKREPNVRRKRRILR